MILVDSSFFIALADQKDQWHRAAKHLLPSLDGETLVISDLIVAEAVTIIGRRSGGKSVQASLPSFCRHLRDCIY